MHGIASVADAWLHSVSAISILLIGWRPGLGILQVAGWNTEVPAGLETEHQDRCARAQTPGRGRLL